MNKKIKTTIIALSTLLFLAISITACFAILPKSNLKPSDYDLGMTFEQASKEDKPILTVFYVDWCTYCQKFMPRLDKVRNINQQELNVVLINVESPENEKIAKEYKIGGFPTVYIIDPKYDNRVHIENSFIETVSDLNKEVQRYINFRSLIHKAESCSAEK